MNADKPCSACAHSGIEPADMDLFCAHPELVAAGNPYGLTVRYTDRRHFPACGPDGLKFSQHPGRTEKGELKNAGGW